MKLLFGALLLVSAGGASAQGRSGDEGSPQLDRLLACRSLPSDAERLSCYDREAANVGQAVQRRDVVVFTREKAEAAKRSLFGFSVPDFTRLFGAGGEEVKQIDAVVVRTSTNRDGGMVLVFKDGSTWSQIDDTVVTRPPQPGTTVRIRKAALGSFMIKIGNMPAFRAKRIG